VFFAPCLLATSVLSHGVVATLHAHAMYKNYEQIDPCSRREFVVTAGLFVAGALVSCSGNNEQTASTSDSSDPHILAMPTTAPVIRIRIGKIRGRSNVNIGETQVTRNNSKWYTSGNKPTHRRSTESISFESLTNCDVIEGNKTKRISGKIDLYPRDDVSLHAFDIVATVPVEAYLPGVLAGELYAHWHPATFAAQAIAARSYAIAHHLQRLKTSHYDVSDDASSQMFLGDVTLDVAHRAVIETSGIVLVWNNTVVPAYYSACCGGTAATALDAISGSNQHNIPPLLGHEGIDACATLDIHAWNTQRDARTFRKRLNDCSLSMGLPELSSVRSIRSIEPAKTNAHGRPNRLAIIDRRKQVVEVLTRDFVRAANAPVKSMEDPANTIWSSFLTGTKKGTELQFDGYGMGHGVGLCQYGAQEMAGRGDSFEETLSWYYPDAELHTIPSALLNTTG
jgi:SpoIID/LytB domain protein